MDSLYTIRALDPERENLECNIGHMTSLHHQLNLAKKDLEKFQTEYHMISNLLDRLDEGQSVTLGVKSWCSKQPALNGDYTYIMYLALEDRLKRIIHNIDVKADEIYNFNTTIQTHQKLVKKLKSEYTPSAFKVPTPIPISCDNCGIKYTKDDKSPALMCIHKLCQGCYKANPICPICTTS